MKTKKRHATWPVLLLTLPAFVAIWSGWVGLGEKTAFGVINLLPGMGGPNGYKWAILNTAITLPIGLETYAAYALHVFLNETRRGTLRKFAGWSALSSLLLGGGGQIAFHVMESMKMDRAPIWVTAIVGSLPVIVLGLGMTLAALVKRAEAGEGEDPERRTLAERVAAGRASLMAVAEAVKVPPAPRGTDIGATPAPYLADAPLPFPTPEEILTPDLTPDRETKVPSQRGPRRLRGDWDVPKAIRMILDGSTDAEISAAVGVGVKSVQRARSAVTHLKRDPHAALPASLKVPAAVAQVVREELRKI
jgi:hypothetical protein